MGLSRVVKYRRMLKAFTIIFNVSTKFAKSSYGSSPLWLHHKIAKKNIEN